MILSIATSQTIELQHKVVTGCLCFLSVVYVSECDVIDNETIISQNYLTPTYLKMLTYIHISFL